ncbi:MAG: UDP-N-acetylmuramoyl-L-alanine--D-glutamate ligase [Candidatus Hydrogenedentota bacterium]|nr:MAG: UDP-N-acetylmuramoyl-L-alanine--D-glutamate ligase [Candidatus Hydrogenedentota bacterium]
MAGTQGDCSFLDHGVRPEPGGRGHAQTQVTGVGGGWRGRRVGVVGWGVSGRAAAALLARHGAEVFVSESRPVESFPSNAREELFRYESETGGHSRRLLENDLLVLSPGIDPRIEPLSDFSGPIWSEPELGFRFLPNCRIVGVTGTNGKTTVTSLMGDLFASSGGADRVFVAGNIGEPLCAVAEEISAEDTVVLELSSFQLELIDSFRADAGVLLNLAADHLDRHGSLEAYHAAKWRLFERMEEEDAAILAVTDEKIRRGMERGMRGKIYRIGEEPYSPAALRGIVTPAVLREVKAFENAACVVAAADHFGIPRGAVLEVLSNFRGLPHRREVVGTFRGITVVDDSKATNVDAVRNAIVCFREPIVLIVGGSGKGESFTPLRERRDRCRAVVAYGEEGRRIAEEIGAEWVGPFEEAVRRAWSLAEKGDLLLLSPGCASFDQFSGYAERGRRFVEIVRGLVREGNVS